MISIEGLTVEFSAKPLFRDVSFVINDHDRIALVGKNGAGKSTMLKILCGEQQPTSGVVSIPGGTTIGYLPQVMRLADDTTVREEARKAFSDNTKMQQQLERMQQEMADRTDFESEGYAQLVERFTHLHDRYMLLGGENYEAEIDRTLQGLGFSRADFCRPTREFSGGWRMRVELAKILLRKPDVLLLDEPTNHLDMPSKDVLKEAVRAFDGTAIIVSHDREFLDGLVTKVYEFGGGHVREHLGGIYDWLHSRRAATIHEAVGLAQTPSGGSASPAAAQEPKAGKQSYLEHKEEQKKLRKARKAVEECERKIARLEARVKELDQLFLDPAKASDMGLVTEYADTRRQLDELQDEWLVLAEAAGE